MKAYVLTAKAKNSVTTLVEPFKVIVLDVAWASWVACTIVKPANAHLLWQATSYNIGHSIKMTLFCIDNKEMKVLLICFIERN